jgi:hypothetical protein
MGCATKYVSRWRKKNGVQDLEKAKHYCEKLKESIRQGRKHPASATGDRQAVERWLPNAGLDFVEKTIVNRIMFWQSPLCIDEAIAGIDHLIATAPVEARRPAKRVLRMPTRAATPRSTRGRLRGSAT